MIHTPPPQPPNTRYTPTADLRLSLAIISREAMTSRRTRADAQGHCWVQGHRISVSLLLSRSPDILSDSETSCGTGHALLYLLRSEKFAKKYPTFNNTRSIL